MVSTRKYDCLNLLFQKSKRGPFSKLPLTSCTRGVGGRGSGEGIGVGRGGRPERRRAEPGRPDGGLRGAEHRCLSIREQWLLVMIFTRFSFNVPLRAHFVTKFLTKFSLI